MLFEAGGRTLEELRKRRESTRRLEDLEHHEQTERTTRMGGPT
jgi:hypothetical protein